jgi:hypothetical protein
VYCLGFCPGLVKEESAEFFNRSCVTIQIITILAILVSIHLLSIIFIFFSITQWKNKHFLLDYVYSIHHFTCQILIDFVHSKRGNWLSSVQLLGEARDANEVYCVLQGLLLLLVMQISIEGEQLSPVSSTHPSPSNSMESVSNGNSLSIPPFYNGDRSPHWPIWNPY